MKQSLKKWLQFNGKDTATILTLSLIAYIWLIIVVALAAKVFLKLNMVKSILILEMKQFALGII